MVMCDNTRIEIIVSDIVTSLRFEIAQEAVLEPIKDVAASIGIEEDDLELYGKYKALGGNNFKEYVDQ